MSPEGQLMYSAWFIRITVYFFPAGRKMCRTCFPWGTCAHEYLCEWHTCTCPYAPVVHLHSHALSRAPCVLEYKESSFYLQTSHISNALHSCETVKLFQKMFYPQWKVFATGRTVFNGKSPLQSGDIEECLTRARHRSMDHRSLFSVWSSGAGKKIRPS